MVHPILETLFFLKVARQSVCESIQASNVKGKSDLINYVRNEASDFEVMHLITFGEMPEQKFNVQQEQEVWTIFKEAVVMNTESLKKEMLKEDIMNIVYEMGPVSSYGYSSAAPILEFDRTNGRLDTDYLMEFKFSNPFSKDSSSKPAPGDNEFSPTREKAWKNRDKGPSTDVTSDTISSHVNNPKSPKTSSKTTSNPVDVTGDTLSTAVNGPASDKKQPSLMDKANANKGNIAAGAVGVAGLYGLYKLYKTWKAKKAAAKTPEAKATAAKGMASVKAKIDAKKKK